MAELVTLSQFLLDQERLHPGVGGTFTTVLTDLAVAAKMINREVTRAGLVDILGYAGHENVHGEKVQKLDQFANKVIYQVLSQTGHLAVLASEEDEDIIPIPDGQPVGKYVVNFDPLDGSSNINANINIGTIFSILPRITQSGPGCLKDCLQPGVNQVAAGYVLYGSSTMLVYTTGNGVHGFTFEPSLGEFLLSHTSIRTPERGRVYSVNESNYFKWTDGVKRYVDWLKNEDGDSGRPYSARYVGSLVADFHRNLLYGGIFLYPGDRKNPNGKLRLLYEAAPLAFIAEQAGGAASDGRRRVLDLTPDSLHQKTPLYLGSALDVRECEQFIQETHQAVSADRRANGIRAER
jgi:fructose-1,6-bisphosphatase I